MLGCIWKYAADDWQTTFSGWTMTSWVFKSHIGNPRLSLCNKGRANPILDSYSEKTPPSKKNQWIWSENTTITFCRSTHGTEQKQSQDTRNTNKVKQPIKMIGLENGIKQCTTKQGTNEDSYYGSNNQQRINNNRTTALERIATLATKGLKRILMVPNLRPRFCCWWAVGWFLPSQ